MPIDIQSDTLADDDKLYPVPQAVEMETGYRPTPSTAWRWTRKGVKGVVLTSKILGARPVTSRRFVREFLAESTARREAAAAQREAAAAEREPAAS